MEYRWRMQSLKTGWGMEAEPTSDGKKALTRERKKQKDKFKYCRIYKVMQELPSTIAFLEPFRLTNRKFFSILALAGIFLFIV